MLPLLFLFLGLFVSCSSERDVTEKESPVIRHIVLFKFKQDAAKQDIDDAFSTLLALRDKIPGIISIKVGRYESHEELNKGFNYGFTIDFEDNCCV